MLSRREFGKLSGLWLFLVSIGSTIWMTGCNVFDDILAWIPVATNAIDGIVAVLGTLVTPSAAAAITTIKALLDDLAAAVQAYLADTNPADKSTLLAKIRTFLAAIMSSFQNFLDTLMLNGNPILKIVLGLATIILSALAGFLGQLPTPTPAPASFRLSGQTVPITPKYYKHVKNFKSDWNAAAVQNGHPEIQIH